MTRLKKERKISQVEVSKMLCTVWSENSKENENKGFLLFSRAFPCSQTVYHSLALRLKLIYPARRRITGRPTAVWVLTGVWMQCNKGGCLSSQHQHVKSPQSLKYTHRRQTAPPKRRDANQLLLSLCKTLKSS